MERAVYLDGCFQWDPSVQNCFHWADELFYLLLCFIVIGLMNPFTLSTILANLLLAVSSPSSLGRQPIGFNLLCGAAWERTVRT